MLAVAVKWVQLLLSGGNLLPSGSRTSNKPHKSGYSEFPLTLSGRYCNRNPDTVSGNVYLSWNGMHPVNQVNGGMQAV